LPTKTRWCLSIDATDRGVRNEQLADCSDRLITVMPAR
jgi:hypothetical protein